MKRRKEKVGGMALFNGLMLRNKKRESIGRVDDNGNISVEINDIKSEIPEDVFTIYDVPIIRGIISMINMITSSAPHVVKSSQAVLKKATKEDIEINKTELVSAYIISITLIIFSLAAIPNFISTFLYAGIRNIAQVIMQSVAFIIYLFLVAKVDDLKTLFEYHGAEHKVANAYEKLDRKDITVENVKKESRFHIRCGGNFVVYLFILVIVVTLIIPSNNLVFKTIIEVILFPFLAGLSYELVMYTNYLPKFLRFLAYPAMSIQLITTKEPSEDKIELAIYTLFGCVDGEKEVNIDKCITSYLSKNRKINKVFDKKDALKIIANIKNLEFEKIYLDYTNINLSYNERIKLNKLLDKLYKEHMPLAYVIGCVNFYNEKYHVDKNVLIPRPDSEILVDTAIKYINEEKLNTMLDMCTGSGCLGISITNNSNLKHSLLVDISSDALNIANKNIALNNMNLKCVTLRSDLFKNLTANEIKYDIEKEDLKLAKAAKQRLILLKKIEKEKMMIEAKIIYSNQIELVEDKMKEELDTYIMNSETEFENILQRFKEQENEIEKMNKEELDEYKINFEQSYSQLKPKPNKECLNWMRIKKYAIKLSAKAIAPYIN